MKNFLPAACVLCAAISGCSTTTTNAVGVERTTSTEFTDRQHSENVETVHHRETQVSGAAFNQSAYVHVLNKEPHNKTSPLAESVSAKLTDTSTVAIKSSEEKSSVQLGNALQAANNAFESSVPKQEPKEITKPAPVSSKPEESKEPVPSSNQTEAKNLMSQGNKLKPLSIYDYDHWVTVCKSKQYAPKTSLKYVKRAGREAMPESLTSMCSLSDSFFE